jgi:hypothetical protein
MTLQMSLCSRAEPRASTPRTRRPALRQRLRSPLVFGCAPALVAMTQFAASAAAQAPAADKADAEDPAESRSAAFQAVDPNSKKEDVPGGALLVAAYGVILVLLVAYVARLGSLYAKNRGELERLTRAVERGGRKD